MAQLNDPSMPRAQALHKIADGADDILRKANMVNTATAPRMLAQPPAAPAKQGETPLADEPGRKTAFDLWTGPCTSVFGNSKMVSVTDVCGHPNRFTVYGVKYKSEAPQVMSRYFRDCKVRGIDIDRGGVMWSDNEV